MEKEELLEEIKKQLDIPNSKKDIKIEGYIKTFQDKVKSICKRNDFPHELDYMCIEFAKNSYLYYSNVEDGSNQKVTVTSAKDHEQTVNFQTKEIISAEDADVNAYANKNMTEISNYAYMGW